MHHNKLKAAVKKYSEQFKTDPEAVKEALGLDYEPGEATEILTALQNPEAEPAKTEEPEKEHPNYKWFDEFEARIQKREVMNQYTTRPQTIITGWSLEKKKQPKFIEPHVALSLNAFADGYDTNSTGNFLVPKGSATSGSVIEYADWAKEQGRDASKDINILLSKN